jgi:hypothetical protein
VEVILDVTKIAMFYSHTDYHYNVAGSVRSPLSEDRRRLNKPLAEVLSCLDRDIRKQLEAVNILESSKGIL